MEAFNRDLEAWFEKIRSGQLRLPRFQRQEAWERGNITAALDSIVRNLPIGSILVLEIDDAEPFISRPLEGAPAPTERCSEHLLDGQQRLTALWKAFNNLYSDAAYFVQLPGFQPADHDTTSSVIVSVSRWTTEDGRMLPKWIEDPRSVYERGLAPVSLIQPMENAAQRQEWCDSAVNNDLRASRELDNSLRELQDKVRRYNIPLLMLEKNTPRQTALDVFIRVNTRSEPLTAMDLVVAQLEAKTGFSLSELMDRFFAKCPAARHFGECDQLVLQAALLRTDKPPSQVYMFELDLAQLAQNWNEITDGMAWAIGLLQGEGIYGDRWLPSVVVVPVLAALHASLPADAPSREKAEGVIREYVWRSFVTGRYDYSSVTKVLRDYRLLRDHLSGTVRRPDIEIFDSRVFAVPGVEEICRAGWPKRRDTLARAILLVSLRAGALNLRDGARISYEELQLRDYQSIIPAETIVKIGGTRSALAANAVNCILTELPPPSAAPESHLLPLSALLEGDGAHASANAERLESHLIPLAELRELVALTRAGTPDRPNWQRCCTALLTRRAELIRSQMMTLAGE